MDLGDDVDAVDDERRVAGIRSATCSTARSSETLMCSPANISSRRSARPDSFGEVDEQSQRLVGDALFRIVEVDAFGLGAKSLAARRVLGEKVSQIRRRRATPCAPRAPARRFVGEGRSGHGVLGVRSVEMTSLHLPSLASIASATRIRRGRCGRDQRIVFSRV